MIIKNYELRKKLLNFYLFYIDHFRSIKYRKSLYASILIHLIIFILLVGFSFNSDKVFHTGDKMYIHKVNKTIIKAQLIEYTPKPKPKLNELFGRNRKGKSEELPTVYESYRKPPELKSALKKTSSFGPQVSEKPKYLTQDRLTPKKLIPKQKRTVMSFSDERFSHFSSYPNDLRPPTDTSFGRDWIVGKNNKY